jgi:hypothetical protein
MSTFAPEVPSGTILSTTGFQTAYSATVNRKGD